MEQSKFFRVVWRFNGIVIAISGILAVVLLSYGIYGVATKFGRGYSARNVVNVEQKGDVTVEWRYGDVSRVTGHDIGVIPLYSDEDYNVGNFSSKSSYSVRNYLFIDIEKESQKWLFDTNDNLIFQFNLLRNDTGYNSYDSNGAVIAIGYEVAKSDTNNDGQITGSDKTIYAISKPDGTGYIELLSELDEVIGYQVFGSEYILVIYKKDNAEYSAKINLRDFKVEKETVLPKAGG